MLELRVRAEAGLLGLGRPGVGLHEVGEGRAVRQPHGLDRRQPGVVDGLAPGLVRAGGHERAQGLHLLGVVEVGGLPCLVLDGQREVGAEGRREVQRGGQDAGLVAGAHEGPHELVEDPGIDDEARAHQAHRRSLGVDEHGAHRGERVGHGEERVVVGGGQRVGHAALDRGLDGPGQLEGRVVVGDADQEGRRLEDLRARAPPAPRRRPACARPAAPGAGCPGR